MVDLRSFEGDSFTLVFDVPGHSIDARTLARALISFVDLAAAVDYRLNPGGEISIDVDALEIGSFRARLRRTGGSGAAGFFSDGLKQVFWGVISSLVLTWLFQGQHVTIKVEDDQVIIEGPDQTVIVSRDAYDGAKRVSEDREVKSRGKEFFDSLELDPQVQGVGFEAGSGGGTVHFPREQIAKLSDNLKIEPVPSRRNRVESARLTILKPSLHRRQQKWSFEWNGVPISARVTDEAFLSTMKRREFVFGYGDALDVELAYDQEYDERTEVFRNDSSTYEVQRVLGHIPSR